MQIALHEEVGQIEQTLGSVHISQQQSLQQNEHGSSNDHNAIRRRRHVATTSGTINFADRPVSFGLEQPFETLPPETMSRQICRIYTSKRHIRRVLFGYDMMPDIRIGIFMYVYDSIGNVRFPFGRVPS